MHGTNFVQAIDLVKFILETIILTLNLYEIAKILRNNLLERGPLSVFSGFCIPRAKELICHPLHPSYSDHILRWLGANKSH